MSLRSWIAGRVRSRPALTAGTEHDRLVHELGQRVDDLARLLAPRPYYFSDQISIADLAVYAMLRATPADSIRALQVHL